MRRLGEVGVRAGEKWTSQIVHNINLLKVSNVKLTDVFEMKFRLCEIIRLGNRNVRASDFFLQKLRFSALCGPNQQKFFMLLT